jgi:RNA polymerase sigma-70 factor, ECF subfamily
LPPASLPAVFSGFSGPVILRPVLTCFGDARALESRRRRKIPLTPAKTNLPSTIVREDEPQLVAAAKRGDQSAFEELVNRYERRIYRVALHITQNAADAEDAMQEAFVKAFQHLKDFQGDSRFYTWLVRIAVNESLMKLRKRRPNVLSLDEPISGDDNEMSREIQDWGPSPEKKFEQAEMGGILEKVIGKLEPIYRAVFVLRDVGEVSTEETAKILDISIPAVKSRLLRARLKLRELLSPYFEGRSAT